MLMIALDLYPLTPLVPCQNAFSTCIGNIKNKSEI